MRRKLQEEEKEEEEEDHETVMFSRNSFEDGGSEATPEEREPGNIYEAKMIEFEDEVEGQFYLKAIDWEDRYWLDFHNLMKTVKGEWTSNFRQPVRFQQSGDLLSKGHLPELPIEWVPAA